MHFEFGTYNDNGTSEKSAWSDLVVEQLQTYGMRFGADIADLYKDEESGMYMVRDDSGDVVGYAENQVDWHKKNRRIFAKVKNGFKVFTFVTIANGDEPFSLESNKCSLSL